MSQILFEGSMFQVISRTNKIKSESNGLFYALHCTLINLMFSSHFNLKHIKIKNIK